jgi:hypothetical protein
LSISDHNSKRPREDRAESDSANQRSKKHHDDVLKLDAGYSLRVKWNSCRLPQTAARVELIALSLARVNQV